MGLRIKKTWLSFLTVILCIGCFVGCSAWGKNPVEAKYDTLPYDGYVIRQKNLTNHPIHLNFGDSDIILISSLDEFEASGIYDYERDEDFFKENALLVMQYTHSSSDKMIEFVDIAIKDGKIYPVVSMELPPYAPICCDIIDTLIITDVKKDDIKNYSFGEVLALNLADENEGSVHHKRFE